MTTPFSITAHRLGRAAGAVRRWPVGSQQRSRRNAMVASTALARRRAEREEVDELLAALVRTPALRSAAHA